MTAPRLITLRQAATELGVPYRTLLERVEVGDLPAVDLRAPGAQRPCWWLERTDVDDYIAARTRNGHQRAQRAQRLHDWASFAKVRP